VAPKYFPSRRLCASRRHNPRLEVRRMDTRTLAVAAFVIAVIVLLILIL
jgi:hypothetical protein